MTTTSFEPSVSQPGPSYRVGRYDLIAGVGRGGMADVYLAVSAEGEAGRFQKLLVLKLLRGELTEEPEFVQMFLDEARLAARLSHPNVVQTLEVGISAGRHFLAMEYVEGQPLNRVMKRLGGHPEFDASAQLTIMLRALAGLEYAHELLDYDGTPLGVVHRDVSPGNILIGYDGHVRITDFGIAKANDSSSQTRVGMFKGKAAYIAPEQMSGGKVDQRADIYSAGVVLWELLTGRRMWGSASQTEILTRVSKGDIPPVNQGSPELPSELNRICMKALGHRAGDRYASVREFAADIEGFMRRELEPKNERELGALIAQAFREDRERLRAIIGQQLSPRAPVQSTLPELHVASDVQTSASLFAVTNVAPQSSAPQSSVRTPRTAFSASQPPSEPLEPVLAPNLRGSLTGRNLKLIAAGTVAAIVVAAAFADRQARSTTAASGAATSVAAPLPSRPAQRGVSDNEITLGMSAVFSGPARELGENMKLGIDTAFWAANEAGGVHGRKLRLIAVDDGYEGSRVASTMNELLEQRRVFAVLGNVGTPTSVVAAPIASKQKTIFFGAFTGAPALRQDPPDRYVFNYRASYREETAASVKYLTTVQKIPLEQIVVFAQEDSYGDAGYEGVRKAVRQFDRDAAEVLRAGYKRNTVDVDAAVAQIVRYHDKVENVRVGATSETLRVAKHPVKAVIMVATYRAAAKFIQKMRDVPRLGKPVFFNVSFVGTDALAEELRGTNPANCQGVHVTQVVPPFSSGATGVRRYGEALAAFQPQAHPGFVSLEGFIVGSVFVEALKRTGPNLTTERLVDTLEQFSQIDLGFGAPLSFSLSEHQGSHKIWGTRLDAACVPEPVDLD